MQHNTKPQGHTFIEQESSHHQPISGACPRPVTGTKGYIGHYFFRRSIPSHLTLLVYIPSASFISIYYNLPILPILTVGFHLLINTSSLSPSAVYSITNRPSNIFITAHANNSPCWLKNSPCWLKSPIFYQHPHAS